MMKVEVVRIMKRFPKTWEGRIRKAIQQSREEIKKAINEARLNPAHPWLKDIAKETVHIHRKLNSDRVRALKSGKRV